MIEPCTKCLGTGRFRYREYEGGATVYKSETCPCRLNRYSSSDASQSPCSSQASGTVETDRAPKP